AALRRMLDRIHRTFGVVVLVDCHSMPSSCLGREERPRADIVLGDRYGTSCAPAITDCAEAALRRKGYQVARNKPYAGGFITEHYGDPAVGFHVIQVEINRSLYMDEKRFAVLPSFDTLAEDMVALRDALAALPLHCLEIYGAAAE